MPNQGMYPFQLLPSLSSGYNIAISCDPATYSFLLITNSFGSTVGAPILFFVGGFIYTVLDVRNELGENDIAHALAFGMWWMTIPYLAIISCAMLASNSTSTLQGIVFDGGYCAEGDRFEVSAWDEVRDRIESTGPIRAFLRRLNGYEMIESVHDGQFKTATMWNRGPNKRQWVREATQEYKRDWTPGCGDEFITPEQLAEGLQVQKGDIFNLVVGTLFLLVSSLVPPTQQSRPQIH
jgi:hypothetical protein